MSDIKRINPPTLPTPVGGAYAQIVLAGDYAHIAGQIALDVDGNLVGGDDHLGQAVQAFTNIRSALTAIDAGPERIVRMTLNIARHTPEVLEVIGQAGETVFGDAWPVAATTLLGVQTLGMPEWLIEVEATAYIPGVAERS